ncbi:hypothetical protein FGO68_gene6956 [Halteria grandinella]|uniref:Uncharacterized protein n=1 Tax=Halteria grandinella TaxID=5974 RepID=A0A8J8SYQ0_HALGN|nr:hypothetical protein FGO68_gene6956 [Halteria grandinella]
MHSLLYASLALALLLGPSTAADSFLSSQQTAFDIANPQQATAAHNTLASGISLTGDPITDLGITLTLVVIVAIFKFNARKKQQLEEELKKRAENTQPLIGSSSRN